MFFACAAYVSDRQTRCSMIEGTAWRWVTYGVDEEACQDGVPLPGLALVVRAAAIDLLEVPWKRSMSR